MAFRKKFPAVRPPEAKIWPNAPLCTVGNFQTKIMPQWKNFLVRPPFIFQNMTFEKEIGAVWPPGAKIWPLHSGEFSKSQKLVEGVLGSKKFTSQTPIFFRNYCVSEVNRRCATTRSRDMANSAPVHSRKFSKKFFVEEVPKHYFYAIWSSLADPNSIVTQITYLAQMGTSPFMKKQLLVTLHLFCALFLFQE